MKIYKAHELLEIAEEEVEFPCEVEFMQPLDDMLQTIRSVKVCVMSQEEMALIGVSFTCGRYYPMIKALGLVVNA